MRRRGGREDARRGTRIADVPLDVAAILAAGGSGQRAGAGLPKQLVDVAGRPIIRWSYDGIVAAGIGDVTVVAPAARLDEVKRLLPEATRVIPGGATRQASVRAGLEHVAHPTVVVHDAARPFAPPQVFAEVVRALDRAEAAVPGLRMKETVKLVRQGWVVRTLDREQVWNIQTPQAFNTQRLRDVHERAVAEGIEAADDAQLVEHYGGRVAVVEGSLSSFKITDRDDLMRAAVFATRIAR